MRILLPVAALSLALSLACSARAQDSGLPDIGSSAGEVIDPGLEADYGAYTLYELRRLGLVLDDPLVDSWLQAMGFRLAAASDTPRQSFTFFMMRDRQINAFATLGGYIGMNAGLVLTAETEDEVAGVMAHEIAHVSQRHVLRAVERAQKDQIPILLAMLGAIAASQAAGDSSDSRSGARSGSNAAAAAVTGAMALMQQRQIDYTRSNESEADRVGIQTLARAGYAPDGMADFFERMQRTTRGNSGGYQLPEYLRSHPVTTTRISETRQRAQQLRQSRPAASTPVRSAANPLLPGLYSLGSSSPMGASQNFVWARDRLRVLSAETPATALREYRSLVRGSGAGDNDALRYGLALAQLRAGYPAEAEATLQALLVRHPNQLWLELARAEAAASAGRDDVASQRFDALLARHPDSRAVRLTALIRLDSDGPWEALRFFDAAGACCWCLHLLPDSDFHAWERLLECLPVEADRAASLCASAWPWKRAAQSRWRACALRLHALSEGRGSTRLAATDVRLSKLGRSCAQRITRQAGASAGLEAPASWPGVPVSWAH